MKTFYMISMIVGLLCMWSGSTKADEWLQAVRVTCIPEMQIFNVDPVLFNHNWPLYNTNKEQKNARENDRKTLVQHGLLLLPGENDYSCKLKSGTYRVKGFMPEPQAKDYCGVMPRITLSLYKDEHMVFKDVYFSSACNARGEIPYIDSLVINNERPSSELGCFVVSLKAGNKSKEWLLSSQLEAAEQEPGDDYYECLRNHNFTSSVAGGHQEDAAMQACESKIKIMPHTMKTYDQPHLECLLSKGFFDPSVGEEALEEC